MLVNIHLLKAEQIVTGHEGQSVTALLPKQSLLHCLPILRYRY